uniref:Predicted protein n=1 Tax=Hordeum vulgare subsp. vulgare TaxID=112509 RepID=F2EEV9_HORVV|nr:predicted protein [Hordeum vulgare subsp. vulgare]
MESGEYVQDDPETFQAEDITAGTGTPETDDPDGTQLAWQYDEETDRLSVNYPED